MILLAALAHAQSFTTTVPMEDGVELATDVWLPWGTGPWPVLLIRTPYDKSAVSGADFAAVGVAVVVLVLVADLRGAIGFSSFGVLLYYLVANASALRQPAGERLVPRWLSWLGAIGCLVLVVTLPPASVVAGVAVFAVGAAVRAIRLAVVGRRTPSQDDGGASGSDRADHPEPPPSS